MPMYETDCVTNLRKPLLYKNDYRVRYIKLCGLTVSNKEGSIFTLSLYNYFRISVFNNKIAPPLTSTTMLIHAGYTLGLLTIWEINLVLTTIRKFPVLLKRKHHQ